MAHMVCNTIIKYPSMIWYGRMNTSEIQNNWLLMFSGPRIVIDTFKALKKKAKEPEALEPEPKPTTEVLFLCSYEGCRKTFIDASALKKHSHIHRERQYVCHYEGCGKILHIQCSLCSLTPHNLISESKILDSSKLKRHFLIHTGERDFVCPLKASVTIDVVKYTPASNSEKQRKAPKPTSRGAYNSASSDRPNACPYEGCEKAYIHEYKLKLHLRREHPGHTSDENADNAPNYTDNDMDEAVTKMPMLENVGMVTKPRNKTSIQNRTSSYLLRRLPSVRAPHHLLLR
ncbi:hypothetical protein UlMin_030464 [Ulmus minor]